MHDDIFILKDDLIKRCEKIAGVGKDYFDKEFLKDLNDIIEQEPVIKEKYIDRNTIYAILDVVSDLNNDYDEIKDELIVIPSVRFVDSFCDKEIVSKEDIITTFKELLDYEGIAPGTPDYEEIMNTIKSVPTLKLEV